MTEFQSLVYAAEVGITRAKGTGGDFTPAWALCDWLQERDDPRVETIRYTLKHCEEHAADLNLLLKPASDAIRLGTWDVDAISAILVHHHWLMSTNKRLMLLLANHPVPAAPAEFDKTPCLCWLDAVEPPLS